MKTLDYNTKKLETPLTTWTVAEGMDKSRLYRNLCVEGHRSKGSLCRTCESICAFGREYIKILDKEGVPGVKPIEKKPPKPKKMGPKRIVKRSPNVTMQVLASDGKNERYFSSVASASRYLGVSAYVLRNSIEKGRLVGDYICNYFEEVKVK